MSLVYTPAKRKILDGTIPISSADLRIILLMSNTTAAADEDADLLSSIGTLDEYNGTNYTAATGYAVQNRSFTTDTGADRGFLDYDDLAFPNLGAGTRACVGYALIVRVTPFLSSLPVLFQDQGGFPFTATGSTVTIQVSASGALGVT